MAKFRMRKGPDGHLHAADQQAEEYLKRFKVGDDFEAEVKFKRNGKHHRKGMAALQFVFDNQSRYSNFESFLIEVKILTGYVETHIGEGGQVYYVPKSIAFDSMDELEFGKWKSEALTAVFERFIPQMPKEEQQRVIDHMIGFF